jgi:hypothetical protein
MLLAGNTELLGERLLPLLLSPPQIPHELVWDPTWAYMIRPGTNHLSNGKASMCNDIIPLEVKLKNT